MPRPCFTWRSHTYQYCIFLFGLFQLVYLHFSIWYLWSLSANAALPPHPRLQIFYPPSAHLASPPSAPFPILVSLPPQARSGFFNGMPQVLKPEALNFSTSSRFILWILPASRNPNLTRLPLSGSLDTQLCDLVALTLIWHSFS